MMIKNIATALPELPAAVREMLRDNGGKFDGVFYVHGKLGSGTYGTSFRLVNATADAKTPCLLVKLLSKDTDYQAEIERVAHVAENYKDTRKYTSLLESQPNILLSAIANNETMMNKGGILFDFTQAVYMRTGLDTCDFSNCQWDYADPGLLRVLLLARTLLATNLDYMANDEFHNDIKDNNVVLLQDDNPLSEEVLLIDYGGFCKSAKPAETIFTPCFAFYDTKHEDVQMIPWLYDNLPKFLNNPIQRLVVDLRTKNRKSDLGNLREIHMALRAAPDKRRYCYMRKMNVFAIALTLHVTTMKYLQDNDVEIIREIINELLGSCGNSYLTDADLDADKMETLDGMRSLLVKVQLEIEEAKANIRDRASGGGELLVENRRSDVRNLSGLQMYQKEGAATVPRRGLEDLVMTAFEDDIRNRTTWMGLDELIVRDPFVIGSKIGQEDLAQARVIRTDLEYEAEGGGGRAARTARAGPRTARGRALRLGLGALLAAVCAAGSLLAA
jgi:hypothetical protein